MKKSFVTGRGAMIGLFAVLAGGGMVSSAVQAPPATAGQDPCAASQVARTVGMVATSTGTYLDAHPETNQALTAISQQPPGPQTLGSLKAYFDAHPQEGTVMQQLQQPLVSLTTQCKLPLTLPQLMGLMQATGGGAGGLSGLPNGATSTPAQTVFTPPAQAVAATPGPSGASGVSGWNPNLPGVTTATSGSSGSH